MSTLTGIRLKPSVASTASLNVRIVSDFDDPAVALQQWNHLLSRAPPETVNLTWQWQRNWWNHFGRGELLLVVVERDGEVLCIAPLFAENGMIFNICPEDQLDFIGNGNAEVIEAVLRTVCQHVSNFQGMKLYFISESSPTSRHLQIAAERLGLICMREDCLGAPRLVMADNPDLAARCTRKKSLIRHENYFRRTGTLSISHCRHQDEIFPQLDEFFSQHIARRAATASPSLFVEPTQRDYYRDIVATIGPTGWLRFTRIEWNCRAIAFHFGLSFRGRFLFGIPSFDIELQRYSPGEVLLRHVLLTAIEEGATVFDFGPGEEPYKYRFADSEVPLVTWGIYRAAPTSTRESQ